MLSFPSAFFNQANLIQDFSSQSVEPTALAHEKRTQDPFAYQRLNQAMQDQVGVELPPEQAVSKANGLFDVDAVVDTVLGFIGERLAGAAQQGASEDELSSMMAAARSGVETGFNQAREQIEALEKMNEPLAGAIDDAEQGIYLGLDEMADRVSQPEQEQVTSAVESVQYAAAYERVKNSFEFELTTQEGDVVTIRAFSQSEAYGETMSGHGNGTQLSYDYREASQAGGYDLQVKGDLNDEEMAAIEALVGQVNDLSDEFYNGDLATAFDMAMNLTSDADQIAQFSLNLSQRMVSAYEQGHAYGGSELPRGLAEPLANFAGGLRDAFTQAAQFDQPSTLIQSLFEQMNQGQNELPSLLQPMLDVLDS